MIACEHCGSEDARWIPPATRARLHEAHEWLCSVCVDDATDKLEEDDLRILGYVDYGPKPGEGMA